MEALCAFYADSGLERAAASRVAVEGLGEQMAQATVDWILELTDRHIEFSTRYWLVDRGAGARIAAVLAFTETSTFAGS